MHIGVLSLLLGVHLTVGLSTDFKRVCYITPLDHLQFHPEKVPVELCTHIIYGFSKVADNGTLVPKNESHIKRYKMLTNHTKHKSSSSKVLLSVSEGNFSVMAASNKTRHAFVTSVARNLGEWGFDGLDIDWEFPEKNDTDNYVKLLKELNTTLRRNGTLVTLAVPGWENYINQSYMSIIPNITDFVDFVNLMSYDYSVFNEKYRNYTGPNSPLFIWSNRTIDSHRYVAWSAEYWVYWGMPREKIVVGIPTFARTYHLINSSDISHGYYTPADGTSPGKNGKVSLEWTCKFVRNDSATRVFSSSIGEPYAYKKWTWVSYDDSESVKEKVEWIKANNFSGVMTYTLTNDDNNGTCGNGTYPLHHLIYNLTNITDGSG